MSLFSPEAAIHVLDLSPRDVVLDAGVGSGAYSRIAAKKVSAEGTVYAADIHKDLLTRIADDFAKEGYANIHTLWANIEAKNGIPLADGVCDSVLLCNTLFMTEHKHECVTEILRVLKKNGTILVVDWSASHGGTGPHIDHVFNEEDARALFGTFGCSIIRTLDATDSYQYGFVAKKV